jgi:DUF1680 family protein
MRKTTTYLSILLFSALTAGCGGQQENTLSYFPLKDVTLLEGPFLQARQTGLNYIMALDPDRLLAPFLREAGLEPKAENYPNWENTGLDGHIGGHYLSALAMMWASTGDAAVKERLDYMLGELRRAQEASGNGFVGGTPGSRELWARIKDGDIRAGGFDLNGKWVPLYNIHKTFAGLRDAYIHGGSELAKTMLTELTDWMAGVTEGLSEEQMQDMLRSEHGGLNETFADVAAITGDRKYLDLARRFSHRFILDPLVRGTDSLTGLHANTQIPKVIGYERIAQLSRNDPAWNSAPEWDAAARFFWESVVANRSVAIGGNSVREHFHPADDFSSMLRDAQGPETCNTYNMLRLTKMLYRDTPEVRFADYYERALYNHILASQHPEKGGFVYFTSMRPGHYRVYSQPETSMWCCVGSGMENHSKYGEFIYARSRDTLWVNLFIPSRVTWHDEGVTLSQQTRFPDEERITFTVEKSGRGPFALRLRYPGWAKDARLSVNGEPQRVDAAPGEYITLTRRWRAGDEIVLELAMEVRVEDIPDGRGYRAFMYGPVVLAAPMGTEDMEGLFADDGRMSHVARGKLIPAEEIPALATDPALLRKTDGKTLAFIYTGDILPTPHAGLRLIPFFRLHDQRYIIYFPNEQTTNN